MKDSFQIVYMCSTQVDNAGGMQMDILQMSSFETTVFVQLPRCNSNLVRKPFRVIVIFKVDC